MAKKKDIPEWDSRNQIADKNYPGFAYGFADAIDSLQEVVSEKDLVAAVTLGSKKAINKIVNWSRADFAMMDKYSRRTVNQSANNSAKYLGVQSIQADDIFDEADKNVNKWIERNSAVRVTNMNKQQRGIIVDALRQKKEKGLSNNDTAKLIGDSLGMNRPQMNAMKNLREKLEAKGKSQAEIQVEVDIYKRKAIAYRAKMIAASESIDAAGQGQLELWDQARAQDLIPSDAKKNWDSTPDEKRCKSCKRMHGQKKNIKVKFVDPTGTFESVLRPSLHNWCRCSMFLTYEI